MKALCEKKQNSFKSNNLIDVYTEGNHESVLPPKSCIRNSMDSESLAEPQAWISGLSYPNKLTPTSLLPHHTASKPNIWVGTASGNYCLFLVATDSFEYTALHTAQLNCGLQKAQTLPTTCSEMLMHSYKTFPAKTGCAWVVGRNRLPVVHWPVKTRCANRQIDFEYTRIM